MSAEPAVAPRTATSTTPESRRRYILPSLGAIVTAVLASLCCAGPILFVTLGIGAGLASQFEPLRPLFAALTLVLLVLGFYTVYGSRSAAAGVCATIDQCAPASRHRRRDRALFWGATVIALVALTFPRWSLLFV